jgi:hypothetical protein
MDLLDLWGLEKYASEWLIEGREMEARGEKFKGACLQILGALTSGWNATLGINDDVNERMAEVDAEYREGERNGSKSKGEVALYRASRSATMASGLAGAGFLSSSANALNNPSKTVGAMYDGAKAYPGKVAGHAEAIANDPSSVNAWSDAVGDVADTAMVASAGRGLVSAAKSVASKASLAEGLNAGRRALRLEALEEAKRNCRCKDGVGAVQTTGKTYVTYTKRGPNGEVYSGRSSGPLTMTPEEIVARRDKGHHLNEKGFEPAVLDRSSENGAAIRGREQYLIEANGGSRSSGGTSGNAINGVSPTNKKASYYRGEAEREFGGEL